MTELDCLFVAWCVLAPLTFLALVYFVVDYVRLCRQSRFDLPEPTPSPLHQRRPRTTMPTPLYGERR